jgi:hypothetical protein
LISCFAVLVEKVPVYRESRKIVPVGCFFNARLARMLQALFRFGAVPCPYSQLKLLCKESVPAEAGFAAIIYFLSMESISVIIRRADGLL